jgi:hypothetical protein
MALVPQSARPPACMTIQNRPKVAMNPKPDQKAGLAKTGGNRSFSVETGRQLCPWLKSWSSSRNR